MYSAVVAAILIVTGPVYAAKQKLVEVLCIDGVVGGSLLSGYVGCSELTGYSQSLVPPASGLPTVCEGRAQKAIDSASPAIWIGVVSGTAFASLFVAFINPETGYEQFRATMTNVLVREVVNTAVDGNSISIEEILLVPEAMTLQFLLYYPTVHREKRSKQT